MKMISEIIFDEAFGLQLVAGFHLLYFLEGVVGQFLPRLLLLVVRSRLAVNLKTVHARHELDLLRLRHQVPVHLTTTLSTISRMLGNEHPK